MEEIKSYTNLEQSKVLAKTLPLESADMSWKYQKDRWVGEPDYREWPDFEKATDRRDIPCWSLAALLGVLPTFTIDSSDDHYFRVHCYTYFSEWHNNPVDACYAIIIKLHEANIL